MPPEPPAITSQGLVITVILFTFAHFTFGHVSVHRDSASRIGRKVAKHSSWSNFRCCSLIGRVNNHERAAEAKRFTV